MSGFRSEKVGGGLVLFVLFSLGALLEARYAFGCENAGLMVTDGAVVIRNPLRRFEVPISELRRFAAGKQGSQIGNPTPGIVLELRNGSIFAVWTLAREGFVWNSAKHVVTWTPVAGELNALLQPASERAGPFAPPLNRPSGS